MGFAMWKKYILNKDLKMYGSVFKTNDRHDPPLLELLKALAKGVPVSLYIFFSFSIMKLLVLSVCALTSFIIRLKLKTLPCPNSIQGMEIKQPNEQTDVQ